MPTTEYSTWDYAVSYGGPSLFMTVVFVVVLPLVYFKLARPRFQRWPPRLAVLLGVWLVAWCIAYGDVLLIAREAKRLCETEAGLRVYRQDAANGFLGTTDIKRWASFGFSYVENKSSDGKLRIFEIVDGVVRESDSPLQKSEHEFSISLSPADFKMVRHSERVTHLRTGKVIGEQMLIFLRPGWIDSVVGRVTGIRQIPKFCWGNGRITTEGLDVSTSDLIVKTLLPEKDE